MEPTRRRLTDDDLIYFVHIPRTGGTTFHELLASRFPADRCRKGGSRREVAEDLRRAAPSELARLRLISGHHDTNVTALLGRRPFFVTMLREPVARTMSWHEILKKMPEHPLHHAACTMTFLEFLGTREAAAEANRQTRQIAGAMDVPSGRSLPSGGTLLDLARECLADFAFFGLRERYEDSLRLLAHTFAWKPFPKPPVLNASGAVNHRLRLGPRELELVQERNVLDLELWSYARRLFRERLETPAGSATTDFAEIEALG
jgi:hypothetical protein